LDYVNVGLLRTIIQNCQSGRDDIADIECVVSPCRSYWSFTSGFAFRILA
jgi:hypothetical protein